MKILEKEWKITYELFPLRALYTENVVANTKEGAIDFLETIKRQKIRIKKVEEVTA